MKWTITLTIAALKQNVYNRLRMFWSGALHDGCAGFRIFQNLCDPAKPRAMQRQKQVVDFKKVGMASRRDVVCCCVNWHRTGKSARKTGRTQLRFKLNRLNIFALVAFGGVCTRLWPNCKPKSGLPKRKKKRLKPWQVLYDVANTLLIKLLPSQEHSHKFVASTWKRAVCDLIWCGQLVSVQVSKSVTGFNAVPCFLDCHG